MLIECYRCHEFKDEFYFYVCPSLDRGYSTYCKICDSERARENYLKNPNKKKTQVNLYFKTDEGKKTWNRASKRSRLLHPEKWNARYLVKRAIAKGIIVKQPCFICGETDVQAHHEDYSKPLEVIFLCRNCHYKRHQVIKQERIK
jgi:hypothetical protein